MARAHLPGTLCTRKYAVAHLLMQPAPNQHVTYRDGDPLNLRRSNLALVNNRKDITNV
jgi:hypothetical protein